MARLPAATAVRQHAPSRPVKDGRLPVRPTCGSSKFTTLPPPPAPRNFTLGHLVESLGHFKD